MESASKFWSEEKLQVAQLCEDKNTRLFWDNLNGLYFVVKKFNDGSVLHTRETELFNSRNIAQVREFVKAIDKPVKYLFAWGVYNYGDKPTYYAVREDYDLFSSTNWDEFHKETKLYCEHSVKLALVGEMPDGSDICTHASFNKLFVIQNDHIIIVNEGDYKPYEGDRSEPEDRVWSAMQGGTDGG